MNDSNNDLNHRGISRVMSVLRLVAASQETGLRAAEIAAELGLSYTTTHRILSGLLAEQAVEKTLDEKRYCIGPEISLLGLARTGHFPLKLLSMDGMQRIRSAFGETCYLTVRSQFDSVCIHREIGTHARKVMSISVGSRRPMGVVIGSVAYLAAMPEHLAEEIIRINAHRYPYYHLSATEVLEHVKWARKNRYAYAKSGLRPGTRSVSAVIEASMGQPLAALSVVAVVDRLPTEKCDEIASMLIREGRAIGKFWQERRAVMRA